MRRATITLAAIPVAAWAAWPARPPAITVKAVATEGVRAQRQDAGTFRLRWSLVGDLPPAVVEVPVAAANALVPLPVPRNVKRASLRPSNVCARHGMRKVTYQRGRWQGWRCRR